MSRARLQGGTLGRDAIPLSAVYSTTTTQKFQLGTRFEDGFGNVFRYAKAGAVALTKALMCTTPAAIANHQGHTLTSDAFAAGAKSLAITDTMTTALLADEYNEGTLTIETGTGLGSKHIVKSHTASATPTIDLYEGLATATATGATLTLEHNPWRGVLVFPTTAAGIPVGVPLVAIAAASFGWLQVRGMAPLIVDTGDTIVKGNPVGKPGTHAVAGACGVPGATDSVWGVCQRVAAAAAAAQVFLNL